MKGMYRYFVASALLAALLLPAVAAAASNVATSGIVKFYSDKASYYPNSDIKLVVEFSAPFNGTIVIRVTNAEGKVVAFASANLRDATQYVYVYKHNETTDGIGTFTAELTYSGQALIAGEWQTVYSAQPVKITFTVAPSYSIKGYVVDENGKPVAGATVCVKETGAKTVTGQDGSFVVPVSSPGRYTVVVKKTDYMPNMTMVDVTSVGVTEIKKPIVIESQVYVIKKLMETQEEMAKTLSDLADKVSDLATKYDALAKSVNDLASKLSSLQSTVQQQGKSISDLQNAVSQLQGQVKALANQAAALAEQVKNLAQELETKYATKDYVDTKVADVKAALDQLSGQLSSLQQQLTQLSNKLSDIANELETKYATKDYVDTQISAAKKEVMDKLGKEIADVKNRLDDLQNKLTNLQNTVVQQLGQQMQQALNSANSASKWALAAVVVAIIGIIVAIYVAVRMMKLTAA